MEIKKALLIIDIQNDYFEGGANPLTGSLEACINAKRLLDDFRSKSLPVVHIQHFSTRPDSSFFIPNTNGVEIHDNVKPANGEKVIVKNYPNSFRETGLLYYLQSNRITDLVICGMMTHMCVDATTRAAKDFGFTCEVIGDACATKDLTIHGKDIAASEVQKSFLSALNYFYSTVRNTDEYLTGFRVFQILNRFYVQDIDNAIHFYEQLSGVKCSMRFQYKEAELELTQVGNILILAGSEKALEQYKDTKATFVVDSVENVKRYLLKNGGTIVRDIKQVPTGKNLTVKNADGIIIEYVEFQ